MYIPNHNKVDDFEKVIAFMQQFPFAVLVTDGNGVPVATHLPFVTIKNGDEIILTAHMAKANKHWQLFAAAKESLVVFTEPHAYVSTSHYEKAENVPTWNYAAVHVYGKPEINDSEAGKIEAISHLIRMTEESFLPEWEKQSEKYRQGLLNGVVAFNMKPSKIEAKFKLSQNRSLKEQTNIIESFKEHESILNRQIAEMMEQNLKKK